MKIRKIISVLLVMTVLLSIPACGSSDKTANGNTQGAGTSEEPVNLIWIQGGNQPKEYAKVMEELNKMSAEDIGVTVDIKYYENEKTLLAMSTGEYFDIAFTCEWYNNHAIGAQKGYFADITEKIKESAPDLYEYIPEVVWNGSMVQDHLYAIPVYKDSAATQYWCFDEQFIVDELGMDLSKVGFELDTLTPILEAAKAKKPNEYPIVFHKDGLNGFGNQYEYLVRDLWIGVPYEGSAEVVSLFDQADIQNDFAQLHEWYQAGYINPDAPQLQEEPKYSAVWSGQGFVGADAIWSSTKDHKVTTVKKYGPVYSTASIRGAMNGISANSKNIDAALKYLQYVNLDVDYRNMLAYGIEGEHYKKTEEGTVERLNDGFQPWTFSQATFFTMYPTSPAPANQWELVKEDIQNAPGSPLIGFTADISEIETEIAAAKNIIDKYKAGLLTGSTDHTVEIPKMMEELEAVGYRDIIAKIQEQVDTFK